MKVAFSIPSTPTCKVTYTRGGVLYSAILKTPQSTDALLIIMLDRHVGASQIKTVDAIQPQKAFSHSHPAQHRMSQYASAAEH